MQFTSRKKTIDMLEQKRKALHTYESLFDSTVSAVTCIIDSLQRTSSDIEHTLAEIDEYQKELISTSDGLKAAKEKNDKVIKNFRALVAE